MRSRACPKQQRRSPSVRQGGRSGGRLLLPSGFRASASRHGSSSPAVLASVHKMPDTLAPLPQPLSRGGRGELCAVNGLSTIYRILNKSPRSDETDDRKMWRLGTRRTWGGEIRNPMPNSPCNRVDPAVFSLRLIESQIGVATQRKSGRPCASRGTPSPPSRIAGKCRPCSRPRVMVTVPAFVPVVADPELAARAGLPSRIRFPLRLRHAHPALFHSSATKFSHARARTPGATACVDVPALGA